MVLVILSKSAFSDYVYGESTVLGHLSSLSFCTLGIMFNLYCTDDENQAQR